MSIKVGVGLCKSNDPILAAKEALRKAANQLAGEKAELAIVFSSFNLSFPVLLKTLSEFLEEVPIVGCSSAAVISNAGISKQGLVIMLLSFSEETFFNTACAKEINTTADSGEKLGEELLYGFQNVRRDLGIIFLDGLLENSSNLLSGLQERLGKSFPIIGGCASDNLAFKKTYVYFNQEMLSDAASGILLGGKLTFGIGVQHGWKPLGKPRYITKSSANVVSEIDNLPAANIYEDYLACGLEKIRKEFKRISILYPIGIYLPGEKEYLLRNLLSIHDDGSLTFQGGVPQGSQIRLMIGTKESCLAATEQALEEVKNEFLGKKINFVLVFNSISRYILLGRQANKELEIIRKGLGQEIPIIGIYTYGELAPLKAIDYQGVTRFHNQTITILGVGI